MQKSVELIFEEIRSGLNSGPVCYLSTPITSGLREFQEMEKLGLRSVKTFRTQFPDHWRKSVLRANEESARQNEAILSQHMVGYQILNPTIVNQEDWTQSCYDDLWSRVIRSLKPVIATAPNWEYSRGAREEIKLALELNLNIIEVDGTPKSRLHVVQSWKKADEVIAQRGWASALEHKLPTLIDLPISKFA